MVLGAFTSTLEVTDPRYDISCYGVFLEDIPRRLGRNEALDASVEALTAAFPSLHTNETPRHVLVKYGQSLKMLRKCMCDPNQAQTAETLCAVYMTMICQVSLITPANYWNTWFRVQVATNTRKDLDRKGR